MWLTDELEIDIRVPTNEKKVYFAEKFRMP